MILFKFVGVLLYMYIRGQTPEHSNLIEYLFIQDLLLSYMNELGL